MTGGAPAIVQPIDEQQQERVRKATQDCLQRVAAICQLEFAPIRVTFDLRGRAAGQYRVRRSERSIRYNPFIFGKYFDDNLLETVPHEVAHYATDMLYGLNNIRPHGVEWQTVMRSLGAEPRASARYDLSGVPLRRQRRFSYRCSCTTHRVSASRHNRILRGQADYLCRRCGSVLVFAP